MSVKRIKGHKRTYTLSTGEKRSSVVREHNRRTKGGRANRYTNLPNFPKWQRDMLEEQREDIDRSLRYDREDSYISPEDIAATVYMERQRRLLHQHRRAGRGVPEREPQHEEFPY